LLADQLEEARSDRRAAVYYGHYLRREGRFEEAVRVWSELFDRLKLVGAGIELSKLFEHRTRELERAREVLETMLVWPHARLRREEIRRRLERVNRKLKRRAAQA
jgi:hypothetical protein